MRPNLFACGSNGASQLSLNHAEDVSILTRCEFHPSLDDFFDSAKEIRILDLVSAANHALLLIWRDGHRYLLAAGTNTLGQLGPRCALFDDVKPQGRFKLLSLATSAGLTGDWEPVKIAATWTSSFVVYQRNEESDLGEGGGGSAVGQAHGLEQVLVSCGSNDFGELGKPVSGHVAGDKVAVTKPSDNPSIVDLGLNKGEYVETIKGGQRHVIAVVTGPGGQRIIGWGASRKGELDTASYTSSLTTPFDSGISSSTSNGQSKRKGKGKAQAYSPFQPPTQLHLSIPTNTRIIDIALGASHTIALLSDGTVIAWGSDAKGQLADLRRTGIDGIAATWNGSFLLSTHGIHSQGSNTHGQLLRGVRDDSRVPGEVEIPEGSRISRIIAGSEHLLVHDQSEGGKLWSGGWNEHGNLGLGDQGDRPRLIRVPLPHAGDIRAIWAGLAATWVWVE
jgi:protein ATS1